MPHAALIIQLTCWWWVRIRWCRKGISLSSVSKTLARACPVALPAGGASASGSFLFLFFRGLSCAGAAVLPFSMARILSGCAGCLLGRPVSLSAQGKLPSTCRDGLPARYLPPNNVLASQTVSARSQMGHSGRLSFSSTPYSLSMHISLAKIVHF